MDSLISELSDVCPLSTRCAALDSRVTVNIRNRCCQSRRWLQSRMSIAERTTAFDQDYSNARLRN